MIRILLDSTKVFHQITFYQTWGFWQLMGWYGEKLASLIKQTHIISVLVEMSCEDNIDADKMHVSAFVTRKS